MKKIRRARRAKRSPPAPTPTHHFENNDKVKANTGTEMTGIVTNNIYGHGLIQVDFGVTYGSRVVCATTIELI